MPTDPYIKDHQAWLGALQPDGLVVSPAALVDAQAILDTRGIETQQRFLDALGTLKDAEGDDHPAITDFTHFVRTFLGWSDDCLYGAGDPSRPLPDQFTVALPAFGETLTADLAFRDPQPQDPANPWLVLVKVIPPDEDPANQLDKDMPGDNAGWTASPSRRFERLLRESGVPIGLLCNGAHLRLMYAPRGENAGTLTFPIAFMAQTAGRPIVSALQLLLHENRLLTGPTNSRLPALLKRSREFQARVSVELAQQVIDAAFDLLRGLQAANAETKGDLLREVLDKHPAKVYEGLLTVLMRLVFILYAEDRGLMPGGSLYQQHYSVHGLFERLRGDHERYPDTMDRRHGAWAHLLALCRAIHGGCDHPIMKLPARAGYLFDPDRFPFLEGRPTEHAPSGSIPLVPDGTIFRVLHKLLILDGERLSYRTLDVEQIGSVYEVMMGFGIGIGAGPSIAIKPKKSHGAPVPINLDELLAQPGGDRSKWLKARTDQELTGEAAAALKTARTIDDLLAALERRIARSATPSPVPAGAMLLVPSDERRRSGSNYTPRSLTEPIVRKTLEPILKRLGEDATPDQILDLKVCDPAMGSGAFLVEACRQLAEHLVKAWHRHKQLPAIPPDEDELLYARRLIAQRCLYGVDKNPMAADLAKLSMWLATLAKGHPFTFLDHSFRAGDSLVGLTKAQIASFTWEPGGGLQKQIWATLIEPRIEAALAARREILNAGDYLNPETKRQKLAVADEQLGLVRFIGDLAVAAFFAGEKDKQRKEKRQEFLQQLTAYLGDRSKLGSGGAAGDVGKRPQKPVDALKAGEKGVTPFHWEIEFPEVFARENSGFDAVVGNPPFLGGTRVSTELGMGYFSWLTTSFAPAGHLCDLVAYFLRRVFGLLRERGGCFGCIATKTICQGDTRHGGLEQIVAAGGTIFDATRYQVWPGEASVSISVVHVQRGRCDGPVRLDNKPVKRISAFLLSGDVDGTPAKLSGNPYFSIGSKVYGQGFVFDDADPSANPTALIQDLIAREPQSRARILSYVGGEEINTHPEQRPNRWVISFSDLAQEVDLDGWPSLRDIVRAKVKPERDVLGSNPNNVPLKRRWWAYQAHRPDLYRSITGLPHVLICSQVTAYVCFAFVPSTWIYSHKTCVFVLSSFASFATMQSRPHESWAQLFSSTLGQTLNYSPSDCFATFPFPQGFETDPRLEAAGKAYYEFRAALMVRNNEGLTKTYNRFHDPEETSPDILKLRDLHAAMDRAVLDAYGWTDIPTTCEFLLDYEEDDDDESAPTASPSTKGRKKRKPYRYRWPDPIRDEVLARLLALNAKRAEEERLSGRATAIRKPKRKPNAQPEGPDQRGLFL